MFRCAEPTREAFTKGVAELIAIMAEVQPEKTAAARQEAAMTNFAAMLGAVVLARGVSDPKLRRALIDSMRRRLLPGSPAKPRKGQNHGG